MGRIIHEVQLVDPINSTQGAVELVEGSGGMAIITAAGDPARATLYDPDNDFAALTQPVSLTQGKLKFAVADTVNSVDIFGISGDGRPFVILSRSLTSRRSFHNLHPLGTPQNLVIPFSMDDMTAATEYDTGIEVPAGVYALEEGVGIKVKTIDATETLDVGILSSESGGDADGFVVGISVATAGHVGATLADGAQTVGALLKVDESAGDFVPEAHLFDGTAKTISLTLSAGSDTAEGYFYLPLLTPNVP